MAAASGPPDPLLGRDIDGYILEERLGAGGMGVVYRALDRGLNRHVALKLLAPHLVHDAEARRRFQREISTAAAVEHPNIVPIYGAGVDDDGNFFIVMRLVDGPDLATMLKRATLEPDRALRLFAQVADGLQHVHASGLIHRDVKPQNVLIWNDGAANEQALLTDFGIAKAINSATALTLGVAGTPEYVAPEVAQWQPATAACDQYSLACVLFQMLAGESPYSGLELPRAHIDEPVPNMDKRIPEAPRPVQAALERALDKNPSDRFPSVEAFAEAVSLRERVSPGQSPASAGPSLHAELADLLDARPGWHAAEELARMVNERRQAEGREPVSRLQVEARVRAFPQLFRRRGDDIQLRRSRRTP